jgi:hypothetical protein
MGQIYPCYQGCKANLWCRGRQKWLRRIVLKVLTSHPENSKRATTIVKARFQVGDSERIKCINLAQLKRDDPKNVLPDNSNTTNPESAPENQEREASLPGTPPMNDNRPETTTVPGTSATTMSPSTTSSGSTRAPVVSCCDGTEWFEGDTELSTNRLFVCRSWRFTERSVHFNSRIPTRLQSNENNEGH